MDRRGYMSQNKPLILIVGVCASGKTTLSTGLKGLGYNACSFAQEHSVTPFVWRRKEPDFLIYLTCEYSTIKKRKDINWGYAEYLRQIEWLRDAYDHADLVIQTDQFTPEELVNHVDSLLKRST